MKNLNILKMSDHYSTRKIWYLIPVLAIFLQLIFFYRNSSDISDPDVISAVQRAQSASCRRELSEFAIRIQSNQRSQPLLRRSCKLDKDEPRNQKVGCAPNTTNGLIMLTDQVGNASTCYDLCFSYSHSHGGYQSIDKRCFCGNKGALSASTRDANCSETNQFEWFRVNVGIYYPVRSLLKSNGFVSRKTHIKIAFLLILNGESVLQILRLIKNIHSGNHIYYLHIDARNDFLHKELQFLEKEYDNVILAKVRFNTIWGGTSLLRMIISSMQFLILHDWDYLINLSESDFPLKPLESLEEYLSSSFTAIYLKTHNITGYNFIRKQGLDKNFYQCEDRVWRMGHRQLPKGIIYSGGSDWFALPRDFCGYIVSNMNNQIGLVKPLLQLYNFTLLPAESFFHTLALNSEFCDRFLDNNLRLTNWQRKQGCRCQHKDVVDWCGCSPQVYRWSDWKRLEKTNISKSLFFSRKFDSTISLSILTAVEAVLVKRKSIDDSTAYDTRFWKEIYRNDNTSSSVNSNIKTLEQFGQFSLMQAIESDVDLREFEHSKLQSMDLYFNKDRFVGYIHRYCDGFRCLEFITKKNLRSQPRSNGTCSSIKGRSLLAIEVNHGFDTNERLFRDYRPLNRFSKIVVYHEWLVEPVEELYRPNSSEKVQFLWYNNQQEILQGIRIKSASKQTRLSLAHRLTSQQKLLAGQWALKIIHHKINCLLYTFLVFDETSFTSGAIKQEQFNKFYTVTKYCLTTNHNEYCSQYDWTLAHKRNILGK